MQMDTTRAKLCFIACLIVVKFKGKIRPQSVFRPLRKKNRRKINCCVENKT